MLTLISESGTRRSKTPFHPGNAGLIGSLSLVFLGSASRAQQAYSFIDASSLLQICDNDKPDFTKVCHAYLSGLAEGVVTLQSTGAMKNSLLCLPPDIKPAQLRAVVRAALKEAQSLEYGGASSALGALANAYPCNTAR